MRKLLRYMAKADMARRGYSKINRRMCCGYWRKIVDAYPVDIKTGYQMKRDFYGNKKYTKSHRNPVFAY